MPSEAAAERRLHPATLFFRVLDHARSLLVPALLVIFFARGDSWQKWLGLLFVPLVLYELFHYFTLRWRYEAEELVVREGWLFRNVRHVPYARVQNVDLKQGPLHRLFRVAEVKIETAGGGAEEAVLRVIGLPEYVELRDRIFRGRVAAIGAAAPAAPAASTLLRLGFRDLALLALSPTRGMAMIAVAYGIAWEFDLLDRFDFGDFLEEWFAQGGWSTRLAQAGLAAAGGLLLLYLLSLGGTVLSLWGFRLEEDGEVFRLRRGLLTREVATIPRRRIQLVTVRQAWVHRLLRRARILVGTAGGDPGGEGRAESGAHFAPIVPVAAVGALLRRIRPDADPAELPWQPLAPRAARRMLAAALLLALPVAAIAAWYFGWTGAVLGALLLVFAAAHALIGARRAGWSRHGSAVAWRSGAFGLSTTLSFDEKLQTATLRRSPFDRRHGHATLAVDTAGAGKTGHRLRLRYLPADAALRLREDLLSAAAGTRFRW